MGLVLSAVVVAISGSSWRGRKLKNFFCATNEGFKPAFVGL